jgi:hypothetical protein
VLFLLLFAGCLRAAGIVERTRRAAGVDDLLTRLAGAARVSLIAFAVAAVFYPVAYNAYFYFIAGLALAARQAAEGSVPKTEGDETAYAR